MKSISLLSGYIYLIVAIITGIASNGFLKTTAGFSKLNPTIFCILSIVVCIFCLSKAMSIIPVGFTYATYGALTITAVTIFGIFKYNQTPNLYATIVFPLLLGLLFPRTLRKVPAKQLLLLFFSFDIPPFSLKEKANTIYI